MTTSQGAFLTLEQRLVKPFWDAAADGSLSFPRCTECQTFNWYPTLLCHNCYSKEREWVASNGKATIYSWSVVAFPFLPELSDQLPIIPASIDVTDVGIRMVTRLVNVAAGELRPGMPIEVTFRRVGDRILPLFQPTL